MNIKTNEKLLVNVSVMGSVCQPNFQGLPAEPYRLDASGNPFLLPSWGSIVHNVSVGDSSIRTSVNMDLYTSRFGKLQKQKE